MGEFKMYFQQPINTPVKCSSCEWFGIHTDLEMITDFEMRVSPGEPCPAGECPECAALAHTVKFKRFEVGVREVRETQVTVWAVDGDSAREKALRVGSPFVSGIENPGSYERTANEATEYDAAGNIVEITE